MAVQDGGSSMFKTKAGAKVASMEVVSEIEGVVVGGDVAVGMVEERGDGVSG